MARYVETLFRHRLRFTAAFLIPVALAATALVWFANFRATATMRIEDPSSFGATFVPIGWSSNLTPAQNLADSFSQVAKTPAFAKSLSGTLSSSGATASAAELQQVVGSFGADLRIGVSGSHLVTLTYGCHKANLCAQVLADAMTVFQAQLVQAQKAQADATASFWDGQLKDAQASLASAEQALKTYAAANPGVAIDTASSDPQVVQLLDGVRQWKAKVVEAQDGLSLAQYLSTSSVRFIQIGTTVVDTPHLAGSRTLGDGSSLVPAGLVLFVGLAAALAYVALLTLNDKTVGDPRVLERRLGVPVVATIPRLVSSRG